MTPACGSCQPRSGVCFLRLPCAPPKGAGGSHWACLVDALQEVSPGVRQSMQNEFNRLVSTSGLTVQWRPLNDNAAELVFDRLIVVRLRGAGTGAIPATRGDNSSTLGFTHISHGKVLPFAEIECDRVRSVLPRANWQKSLA